MIWAIIVLAIPFVFIFATMVILALKKKESEDRMEKLREEERCRHEFVESEIERRRNQ